MTRLFFVVAYLFGALLLAKGAIVVGNVYDASDAPIADIAVTALSPDSVVLGYELTNEKGEFRLKIAQTSVNKVMLVFYGLGYEQKSVECELSDKVSPIKVYLNSQEFELNEFVVTAAEAYQHGDTINYTVDAFKSSVDRKIEDVLQKMPGVTVDKAGKIEFNGKKVASVMVEGLDLTGDDYAQLTQSVNADDITSVQVLLNNQPIKMLRGVIPSDKIDINLRLRDDKKDVWSLSAMAGVGNIDKSEISDAVSYGASATAMRFSKNSQALSSIDISDNLQLGKGTESSKDIFGAEEYMSMSSMLSHSTASIPNIDSHKQQGHSSDDIKSNWLWRSSEDMTARLNVGLSKSGVLQQSSTYRQYHTIDGQPEQSLVQGTDCSRKAANIDIDLQNNGASKYLKFKSQSDLSYDKTNALNLLNGVSRIDAQKLLDISTQNDFTYKGVLGNDKIIDVVGSLSYVKLNDKISVIDSEHLARTAYQNLEMDLSTNYIFKLLGVRFSCNTALEYDYHSLGSGVDSLSTFDENRVRFIAKPGINYTFAKLGLQLGVPITLQWSKIDAQQKLRVLGGATASLSLRLNAIWRISLTSSLQQKEYNLYDIMPYQFYTSFDTKRVGYGDKGVSNNFSASLNVSYTDMLKGYSAFLLATYMRVSSQPIVKVTLTDDVSLFETTNRREPMTAEMLRGQISKRFSSINGILSLSANFSNTQSYSLSHDEVYPQRISNGGVKLIFSADLFSWLNFSAGTGVSFARQTLSAPIMTIRNSVNTLTGNCKASLVCKGFIGSMGVNLMKNSVPNSPLLSLYDASASYKWSKFEVGLTCENLLNNKSYVRKAMTATVNEEYNTLLMPRHIMATFAITF